MSDTTPNHERPTDAADGTEPAAVAYDPAEGTEPALAGDGSHSDGGPVTSDEVIADPPVTAEPPAIDGQVSDDDVPTSTLADGNVAHTNPVYVERDEGAEERDASRVQADDEPKDAAGEADARQVEAADERADERADVQDERTDTPDPRYIPAGVTAAAPTVVATGAADADQRSAEDRRRAEDQRGAEDQRRAEDQRGAEDQRRAEEAPTEQYPAYQPAPQSPIYVQAPVPPKKQGNRGVGILIALLATVVYALLYAGVIFLIALAGSPSASAAVTNVVDYLVRPVYYVPVIFFFLAFIVLIAIVNRGGWWAYVLFGFLVAVVVYFSYIGGALLTVQAWTFTPQEAANFISTRWLDPGAIASAVIAREVPIWAGAWIASRGRAVTARNADARAEYDRQLAAGPQLRQHA